MGSRHADLQGQSLLELTSKSPNEDVRSPNDASSILTVTLRGFVHFATKEGAMRVLEESAGLGLNEFPQRVSFVVFAGSITFHRRKLDIKAPE